MLLYMTIKLQMSFGLFEGKRSCCSLLHVYFYSVNTEKYFNRVSLFTLKLNTKIFQWNRVFCLRYHIFDHTTHFIITAIRFCRLTYFCNLLYLFKCTYVRFVLSFSWRYPKILHLVNKKNECFPKIFWSAGFFPVSRKCLLENCTPHP